MDRTRYIEQTVHDLECALNDLVALGLFPPEAARAVMEIVTIRMKRRMGEAHDVDTEPDTPGVLRHVVARTPH